MGQSLSCGNVEGQQLLSAIREEDIRYVETLAKEDPKVLNRAMLFRRQTPLHLTASLGHYEVSCTCDANKLTDECFTRCCGSSLLATEYYFFIAVLH